MEIWKNDFRFKFLLSGHMSDKASALQATCMSESSKVIPIKSAEMDLVTSVGEKGVDYPSFSLLDLQDLLYWAYSLGLRRDEE
jgi:hypothetical protein